MFVLLTINFLHCIKNPESITHLHFNHIVWTLILTETHTKTLKELTHNVFDIFFRLNALLGLNTLSFHYHNFDLFHSYSQLISSVNPGKLIYSALLLFILISHQLCFVHERLLTLKGIFLISIEHLGSSTLRLTLTTPPLYIKSKHGDIPHLCLSRVIIQNNFSHYQPP